MEWKPVSQYAQTCGEFTISKAKVGEVWKYTLWRGAEPGEMMGIFETVELAKKEVKDE